MKVLNKFLWMCFTFVVNVFYNPNSVFGYLAATQIEANSNTSCAGLKKTPCHDSENINLDEIKAMDLGNKVGFENAKNTYIFSCTINGKISYDVSSCISSEYGVITSVTAEVCPEDGRTADAVSFSYGDYTVWVCGNKTLGVANGILVSGNANSTACRQYKVQKWSVTGENAESDCYKPANVELDDEKGIFKYTEDCYIDTE